jgi:DNA-binding transcriptional ArsR family regulator
MKLSQEEADEYAAWFRCLSDGTRIRILNYLATRAEPATVGEVVEAIGKSQSTVSKHLQILAEDRFVFTEADGIRTLVTVNTACMTALPDAAAAIMVTPDRVEAG